VISVTFPSVFVQVTEFRHLQVRSLAVCKRYSAGSQVGNQLTDLVSHVKLLYHVPVFVNYVRNSFLYVS